MVDGLLIDTGCAHSAAELVNELTDVHISAIVNTHSHEDHIGANGLLQNQRRGLEIHTHPQAIPVLAEPRESQPLQPYRKLMWGWPEPSVAQPLEDGQTIDTPRHRFQVYFTPGHSPDHLCLVESEQGWVFTGDLYVGGRDRALRVDYDIWEIIASLKRIATLPSRLLFPGCARVRENAPAVLADKIVYLEELGKEIMTLHQQGRSEKEIVQSLLGGSIWIETITLGHFSRRHLVRSYLR
jgi:glyoxylase-like metal-dependent hydrolase (beta-lactamase superfamily II)